MRFSRLLAAALALLALAPSLALSQGAIGPLRLPSGSTGPADNLTVGGTAISTILGSKAPVANPVFSGAVTTGNRAATVPLLSLEDPAPIVDLRSQRVYGFSGIANTGMFSMCGWTACDDKRDVQVVRGLLQGRSTRGALNAESNLALDYWVNTGYVPIWKPSTAVATGSYTTTRNPDYRLYQATTGGTTGNGGGPSGTGTSIADGSVTWKYIQPGDDTNNKTNLGITTYAGPGAANTWNIASNIYIDPGFRAQTAIGYENDLHNDGPDCTSDLRNCFGYFGYFNGPGTNTAFISLSAAGGVTPLSVDNTTGGAAFNGIVLDGKDAIRLYGFIDATNSKAGFKCDAGTRKNEACFFDFSNGATGQLIKGTKTYAGIVEGSMAPVGLSLDGTYGAAAIRYMDFLVGRWDQDSSYSAITLSKTFTPSGLMGFFGKNGDSMLYSNAPGGYEQRVAGNTVSQVSNTQAKFYAPITSTTMIGDGTRYACINPSGTIFASTTICR